MRMDSNEPPDNGRSRLPYSTTARVPRVPVRDASVNLPEQAYARTGRADPYSPAGDHLDPFGSHSNESLQYEREASLTPYRTPYGPASVGSSPIYRGYDSSPGVHATPQQNRFESYGFVPEHMAAASPGRAPSVYSAHDDQAPLISQTAPYDYNRYGDYDEAPPPSLPIGTTNFPYRPPYNSEALGVGNEHHPHDSINHSNDDDDRGDDAYSVVSSHFNAAPVDELDSKEPFGVRDAGDDAESALEGTNVRYGELPVRQPRRWKTMKRVELYKGNLILDCPVPNRLLSSLAVKEGREFTHMRYTAATCDPADFIRERFTLRQPLYDQPRQTELFIVATMYNEDEVLFTRTMYAIQKNIAHLVKRNRSRVWGENGWKKIVVAVVSDGRRKIHPKTLAVLAAMGVYQDGVAKSVVNDKPVSAHIYEYTSQIAVDPNMDIRHEKTVPVQIIFCLKEQNQKKLNSHRWFFEAFAPVLNPNICVLLDVGTQPGNDSLYHLWKAFDINANVAGACGEIRAMKGQAGANLLNPLVAAQNFEYKISNILDKPFESMFGFISVLPGAFSAYRYIALQNGADGTGPLEKYFKGETNSSDAGIFEANMYLAEDRILCFELVAKRQCSWVLQYVKSAYAETDVPDRLPELVSQRRRWLNGSFFASIYSLAHFYKIWHSSHGVMRKIMFHIEFLYQAFQALFAWFNLANFFIIFSILTSSMGDSDVDFSPGGVIYIVCAWIYVALLVMCFVLGLGNRPQGSKWSFLFAAVFFAVLMTYMLVCSAWLSYKAISETLSGKDVSAMSFSALVKLVFTNSVFRDLIVSMGSTYLLYLVASLLYFEPWHMLTSFVQYLLFSPSYTNIMNVYAFCNVHDVSWGTKGENKVTTELGVVSAKTEKQEVDVAMPTGENDLNEAYTEAIQMLATKSTPPKSAGRDAETKRQDYYRNFRTNVVLAWIISNGALVAVTMSIGVQTGTVTQDEKDKRSGIYMAVILWSVAVMALVRFIGSTAYLIRRLIQGE